MVLAPDAKALEPAAESLPPPEPPLEGEAGLGEEELRERVLAHLRSLGFRPEGRELLLEGGEGKEGVRLVHERVRRWALLQHQDWIRAKWPRLRAYFASGEDLDPSSIRPVLVEVREGWQQDLFRLARLTWSLPYSSGYGRRMRFLLLDEGNLSGEGLPFLIGILGLQSPPISFAPRDRMFRYPEGRKAEMVNYTMDIYALGAVPPYSFLLGGKLVALAAASNEVREAYRRRYEGRITLMENRVLPPHLVALTTTSAFGRSSLYNRLRYKGEPIALSIGYTEGYGTFHLEPLYPLLWEYLKAHPPPKGARRGGYGTGSKIKWQNISYALRKLGLPKKWMGHGVRREAFLFPLARNLKDFMEGRAEEPEYRDLPFEELSAYWRERWLLPRAARVGDWRGWRSEGVLESLLVPPPSPRGEEDRRGG